MFYGCLTAASVSLGLPTQFAHCCLVTARAFMPASLIVIPYTILEISKFLGQLPVDDDDDDMHNSLVSPLGGVCARDQAFSRLGGAWDEAIWLIYEFTDSIRT